MGVTVPATVDLREHIETMIGNERVRLNQQLDIRYREREKELALLRELLDARIESIQALSRLELGKMEQARAIQAAEYERRLEALNHAHEQARETLATYLPREAFESFVKEQTRREELRAKASAIALSVAETRERLETAVKDLASSVEKTQKEVTGRLESALGELKDTQTRREGATQGLTATGRVVVASITAMGALLAIIVLIANHAL